MLEYGLMAPAMFAGLIAFMLFGFPVAFSLSALGRATSSARVPAAPCPLMR